MSYNYQQNPNQQDQNQGQQYDQDGNPIQGQSQQGNYDQQQGQQNQDQQGNYDQQQGQQNQGQQQGQGQDPFGGARQMAQQQIDNSIDQFANKIPGGQQYSQQAKDAASGALNDLEQEAEKRMGNLGGLFGGNQNNQ